MDVTRLSKQLGITESAVVRKARELVGLAAVRYSGGMGQAEVCVAAVCLELACQALQHSSKELSRDKFVRYSCVNAKVYTSTFNMLHQALNVTRKIDLQHLVVQFGCTGIRQTVSRVLGLYKERFVAKLPDADKPKASFSRPVFLAAAFYLVARKHKVKVDLRSLLETLCVSRDDYLDISASMYELCFDVVGVEKTKKKATERKTNTAVLDAHRHGDAAAAGAPSTVKAAEEEDQETAGPSGRSEPQLQQPERKQAQDSAAAPAAATTRAAKTSGVKRTRLADDGEDAWKLMALSGLAAQAPNNKPKGSSGQAATGEVGAAGCQEEDGEENELGDEAGLGRRASKRARSQAPEAGKRLKQSKLVLSERPGNALQLSCD